MMIYNVHRKVQSTVKYHCDGLSFPMTGEYTHAIINCLHTDTMPCSCLAIFNPFSEYIIHCLLLPHRLELEFQVESRGENGPTSEPAKNTARGRGGHVR